MNPYDRKKGKQQQQKNASSTYLFTKRLDCYSKRGSILLENVLSLRCFERLNGYSKTKGRLKFWTENFVQMFQEQLLLLVQTLFESLLLFS